MLSISKERSIIKSSATLGLVSAMLLNFSLSGCASAPPQVHPQTAVANSLYERVVASPIRTDDDRASDASRKPLEFLKFARVAPGMQVMDVAAGGGTTTQMLALAVGTAGKVYAQSPTARPAMQARLTHNPQSNIVPTLRPFDDPVPAGTPPLDLITINLSYHDIANLPIERLKMDRRLFDALKPGGYLVVIDHAAVAGSGLGATRTLHRIDEAQVRADFEQVGFKLDESGKFLRNPADTHEKKSSDLERMSDKFVLRFAKP